MLSYNQDTTRANDPTNYPTMTGKLITFWSTVAVLFCSSLRLDAGEFIVTTTADTTDDTGGVCSLRRAIIQANETSGTDLIRFNIAGAGPHTIQPLWPLPTITDPVTIDGTPTPGWAGPPIIEIDGSQAGEGANGLLITAGNSTVRGLVINRFSRAGVMLKGGGGNVIAGNYVGTDVTGTVALGNGWAGICIGDWDGQGSDGNTVGGAAAEDRNVVSGNGFGIILVSSRANRLEGNFIGTDSNGTAEVPNTQAGVSLYGGSSNRIGGAAAGAGNLISGNKNPSVDPTHWWERGVGISSYSDSLMIEGNLIGTDRTGKAPLGNNLGALIQGTASRIGATESGGGNVISGNDYHGLIVGGTDNVVQGNLVGLDCDGASPLGNGVLAVDRSTDPPGIQHHLAVGISAEGERCTVGGPETRSRNVVSANRGYGIAMSGSGGRAMGNFIGTDATGTQSLPCQDSLPSQHTGIAAWNYGAIIGGTTAGERNVISGNEIGVRLGSQGAQVLGNFIGTDVTGSIAIGNRSSGIYLSDAAANNQIGSSASGTGNLISGNGPEGYGNGIVLNGYFADWQITGNQIQGNLIGTDVTGRLPLGNAPFGISFAGASGNLVGGTEPGEGNVIAFNAYGGILVSEYGQVPQGDSILGNRIHDNEGLGIALGWVAPTPNDPGDGDTGPNNLQNYPVITGATATSHETKVQGSLNSSPNTSFRVEFFANAEPDPSGFGEGETYLGAASVTTGANGEVSFDVTVPTAAPAGSFVTTTVTDPAGNTSEFSGQSAPVVLSVIEVAIDIKPGSNPNSINLGSNGAVPVAILSSATFDARTVNPTTVTLADATVKMKGKGIPMASLEDVDGDGLKDLMVHVITSQLQLTATDTLAVLRGQTTSGTPIQGSDTVRIVPR